MKPTFRTARMKQVKMTRRYNREQHWRRMDMIAAEMEEEFYTSWQPAPPHWYHHPPFGSAARLVRYVLTELGCLKNKAADRNLFGDVIGTNLQLSCGKSAAMGTVCWKYRMDRIFCCGKSMGCVWKTCFCVV